MIITCHDKTREAGVAFVSKLLRIVMCQGGVSKLTSKHQQSQKMEYCGNCILTQMKWKGSCKMDTGTDTDTDTEIFEWKA